MVNKTLIPALKARVGDWDYYICMMKYGSVSREVNFAYELGGNPELNELIQRGISERTNDIKKYLIENNHRFLGALIVAAWGGDPQFTPVQMQDADGLLRDLDDRFGVLTFDGSQQYFALDGQHRLRAIKDAMKERQDLANEDICVILVSHYHTEEGRERTRRLFTNINRNAKATTKSENIALDEDDSFAIMARRLVNEHSFLKTPGRVLVFAHRSDGEGDLSLAGMNIPKTDKSAFTSLGTLYELIKELSFELDKELHNSTQRPPIEKIDAAYAILTSRLDRILIACGDIPQRFASEPNARVIRGPKENEGSGHAMMRPLIQRSICRVIKRLVENSQSSFDGVLSALSELSWRIEDAPWQSVASSEDGAVRMRTQRDNVELLEDLLRVHLFPDSRAQIKRARQDFQRLIGKAYPYSEDDLAKRLPPEA